MSFAARKKVRTIVVWGNGDILDSAVQFILSTKNEWNVVNISNSLDFKSLVNSLGNQPADIIIVNEADNQVFSRLPLMLLNEPRNMRVITISLENNVICVYSKQSLTVNKASDLLSVIEGEVILDEQMSIPQGGGISLTV
jgi:hypothetical protein